MINVVDQRFKIAGKTKHVLANIEGPCVCECFTATSFCSDYVITPIDKATGNVAVICKHFYAMVLFKELGICDSHSTKTYKKCRTSLATIINNQKNILKKKFNLDVSVNNECLPHIYWLPKMHKNSCKFRFIIAAPKCSIKPLNKAITNI